MSRALTGGSTGGSIFSDKPPPTDNKPEPVPGDTAGDTAAEPVPVCEGSKRSEGNTAGDDDTNEDTDVGG